MLSLYCVKPFAFTSNDEDMAYLLAQHATVAVAAARHEHHLELAADARRMIGEATGILMERFSLDSPKAFAVLRRYSQDTNTNCATLRST